MLEKVFTDNVEHAQNYAFVYEFVADILVKKFMKKFIKYKNCKKQFLLTIYSLLFMQFNIYVLRCNSHLNLKKLRNLNQPAY